jgi:hypothetical protein
MPKIDQTDEPHNPDESLFDSGTRWHLDHFKKQISRAALIIGILSGVVGGFFTSYLLTIFEVTRDARAIVAALVGGLVYFLSKGYIDSD